MRNLLTLSLLLFISLSLSAQSADSTTYFKLRETDSVSKIYYKTTYYNNAINNHGYATKLYEGWCRYEKNDSSIYFFKDGIFVDSSEFRYGIWKFYYHIGTLESIVDFGFNRTDSIHLASYDWNGKLDEEAIYIYRYPMPFDDRYDWAYTKFYFFIDYKRGKAKLSGTIINGKNEGDWIFSKNGKTVHKIITYQNDSVVSVQKKLNIPLVIGK